MSDWFIYLLWFICGFLLATFIFWLLVGKIIVSMLIKFAEEWNR